MNRSRLRTAARDTSGLQADIRTWWETNPMTYDWKKTVPFEVGSPEFYKEIDRRFWTAAWFAHGPGEEPFGRLIPYQSLRGRRVLEIGCGSGAVSAQLAKNGALVTAIDLTSHAIVLTRRRFELCGLSGEIKRMDAEHLEFADDTFDFVWSWGVIHHSASSEAIIAEIHRVLRGRGEACVMVYHRNSINFWVGTIVIRGLLCGGLGRYTVQELCNKYSDGLIAKYYTSPEIRRMFEGYFRLVNVRIFGQKNELWQIPGGRLKQYLVRITPDDLASWITRRVGGCLFVSARKE